MLLISPKYYSLTLLLTVLIVVKVYSQDSITAKVTPKLEYSGYGGKILIHREAMENMGDNPYFGNELRLSFQTTGKDYWHSLFKYPSFGIGFYSGYFNNDMIGNPFAVYGFMEMPFIRRDKFLLSTSWSSGFTFNINEFDAIDNPENIAIGTDINVYIDFSLIYKYKISKKLEIGTGIKFQHFSNGAIRHPNLGLNMASVHFIASYLFNDYQKHDPLIIEKPTDKKYEITAFSGFGMRGKSQEEPNVKYLNSVVSLSLNKRVNHKRAIGAGFDFSYNEYIKNETENPDSVLNKELMSYSGFLSTDLIAGKFRMVVQFGAYFYRSIDYSLPIYERVALRYYMIPNVFANVSIKAHGAKAQCVEWGIGCTF